MNRVWGGLGAEAGFDFGEDFGEGGIDGAIEDGARGGFVSAAAEGSDELLAIEIGAGSGGELEVSAVLLDEEQADFDALD